MGTYDKSYQRVTDTGKTFWYTIDFEWKDVELEYAMIADLPAILTKKHTKQGLQY